MNTTRDLVVTGGSVLAPDGWIDTDVWIADGRIGHLGERATDGAWPRLDATGLLVAPGLIDLQVNGGWGVDITTDGRALWDVADRLPRHGVTSFLPTVVTSPPEAIASARAALLDAPDARVRACPLGLHLEGPMINPARRGAHPRRHIVDPSSELIAGWSPGAGIAMVTLAPELPGALEVIDALTSRGVVVSGGHSDATSDEVLAAIDAGLCHVTHLFNAMRPFAHREPGLAGTAMARDDVSVGLIVDGLHVHPLAVAAVWRAKGPEGLTLVSDAASALGMPDGAHELGDTRIVVADDGIRTLDGTLAGSAITLDVAVRNLVAFTGCRVEEAIAAASTTPARLLGADAKGGIAPGLDADLVLLTHDLDVVATIIGGTIAWRS